jgi:hypothetical protein
VSKQFHPLADGEVVSVKNTCKVSDLAAQIRSKVADSLAEWSNEHGVDGEVLRFGSQGWEKGKVRLHLSIEFCPDDGGAAVAPPQSVHQPSNIPAAPAVAFTSGMPTHMSAAATPAVATTIAPATATTPAAAIAPVVALGAGAAAIAMTTANSTVASTAAIAPPAPKAIELPPTSSSQLPTDSNLGNSTFIDDKFELGTMSDISGEINLNLSDDPGGYVDFDLSAAMPDLNLEELVANVQANRPSLVEEVWSEIEQPNWPGVSRT